MIPLNYMHMLRSAFLKSEKICTKLLLVVISGWGTRLLSTSYISILTAFLQIIYII